MHGDKPGHKNPVRGVASDSLNQCVVSADARGIVKFWRFKTQALLEKVIKFCPRTSKNIFSLCLHNEYYM